MAKTAAEAGWHISRYNISAHLPGTDKVVIVNLFKETCAAYSPLELYLLSSLDELDSHHPILKYFASKGLIVNFDEIAMMETASRAACGYSPKVGLTICPTMVCNFDCPYCFEKHRTGKMSEKVQDDVLSLAGRMLDASGAGRLSVCWFGGEPLLEPGIIESLSERLIALAADRHAEYSASIITNGYLLTQDIVNMLHRVRVEFAQITVDGTGAFHDATRHLANGKGTFDHIMENLRRLTIPFRVNIRQNIHTGNEGQFAELSAYIRQIAKESGNRLDCYPAAMMENPVSVERQDRPDLLGKEKAARVGINQAALQKTPGQVRFCVARSLWCLGIDDKGNLYKCEGIVDKPERRFGTAADWDPSDPFETACSPDMLSYYLNAAKPVHHEKCRNCVWLPVCSRDCLYRWLSGKPYCLAYKDHPEEYVLTKYRILKEQKTAG